MRAPVRLRPFEPQKMWIAGGPDDRWRSRSRDRGIVDLRELVARHPTDPLRGARPSVARQRAIAGRAHRDASGATYHVSVDVRVDEVLRRHDEIAKAAEVVPVCASPTSSARRSSCRSDRGRSNETPAARPAAAIVSLVRRRSRR